MKTYVSKQDNDLGFNAVNFFSILYLCFFLNFGECKTLILKCLKITALMVRISSPAGIGCVLHAMISCSLDH